MSSFYKIICKFAENSNGAIKIVKIPEEKRPTAEDLRKLETEIKAHIDANEAMRCRSYLMASKKM